MTPWKILFPVVTGVRFCVCSLGKASAEEAAVWASTGLSSEGQPGSVRSPARGLAAPAQRSQVSEVRGKGAVTAAPSSSLI